VVEMPGEETGPDAAAMKEATKAVAEGSTVKFDIPHRVRAVYGGNWASPERTVAIPTWRCSTGITASIRSRATRSSPGGRRKLARCAGRVRRAGFARKQVFARFDPMSILSFDLLPDVIVA
jgi:hypothetical protein